MSQAVGIRVVRRLSELLGAPLRTDLCMALDQIGSELWEDASNSLGRKDYKGAKREVDELVFLSDINEHVCPARGRGRAAVSIQPVMVPRRRRRVRM